MAWRVLQSGATLEVVSGYRDLPGGGKKAVTTTAVYREGKVIEGDLEPGFVERYEAGNAHERSLVVRGNVDSEGNFQVAGVDDSGEEGNDASGYDRELASRVSELEEESAKKDGEIADLQQELEDQKASSADATASVDGLQQRITELEQELAETQRELEAATAPADGSGDNAGSDGEGDSQ